MNMENKNRRNFIQKAGAVAVWTPPALISVILPVPAQASVVGFMDNTPVPPGLIAC